MYKKIDTSSPETQKHLTKHFDHVDNLDKKINHVLIQKVASLGVDKPVNGEAFKQIIEVDFRMWTQPLIDLRVGITLDAFIYSYLKLYHDKFAELFDKKSPDALQVLLN